MENTVLRLDKKHLKSFSKSVFFCWNVGLDIQNEANVVSSASDIENTEWEKSEYTCGEQIYVWKKAELDFSSNA